MAKLRNGEKSTLVRAITKPYIKGAQIKKICRTEVTNAINLSYLMKMETQN